MVPSRDAPSWRSHPMMMVASWIVSVNSLAGRIAYHELSGFGVDEVGIAHADRLCDSPAHIAAAISSMSAMLDALQ